MKLFLTSSPIGIYRSEEPLNYSGFNPANGMVNALRKYWREDSRCLLVSAFPDEYDLNDRMRADYYHIIRDTGLSIHGIDICDLRNGKEKADNLLNYDFVILGSLRLGRHFDMDDFVSSRFLVRFNVTVPVLIQVSGGVTEIDDCEVRLTKTLTES